MLNVKCPILALDLGDRYIGAAFSEAGILVAAGETIDRKGKSDDQIFRQMAEIIKSKEIQTLVVGLPVNADGSENQRCAKIREFITRFQAQYRADFYFLISIFSPEDFSSLEAKHQISQNFKLNQKRPRDHSQAAQIILGRYFENQP